MAETVKVNIDIASGSVAIECPETAFESILKQVADLMPNLASFRSAIGQQPVPNSNNVTLLQPDDESASGGKRGSKRKQLPVYKTSDLGVDDEAKRAFKKFFESKNPKSQNDQVLLCAFWINKTLGRESFTDDDIFTALRAAGVPKIPARIESVISNLKLENKLVGERGKYRINHIGEDFVNNELAPAAA
jgi:hypothetical protein